MEFLIAALVFGLGLLIGYDWGVTAEIKRETRREARRYGKGSL